MNLKNFIFITLIGTGAVFGGKAVLSKKDGKYIEMSHVKSFLGTIKCASYAVRTNIMSLLCEYLSDSSCAGKSDLASKETKACKSSDNNSKVITK